MEFCLFLLDKKTPCNCFYITFFYSWMLIGRYTAVDSDDSYCKLVQNVDKMLLLLITMLLGKLENEILVQSYLFMLISGNTAYVIPG